MRDEELQSSDAQCTPSARDRGRRCCFLRKEQLEVVSVDADRDSACQREGVTDFPLQERERQVTRVEREAEEARAEVEGRLAAASAALDERTAALSAAAAQVRPPAPGPARSYAKFIGAAGSVDTCCLGRFLAK